MVGESGSGKSTLGEIFGDLQQLHRESCDTKGRISAHWEKRSTGAFAAMCNIFPNPKESMNPYYTVERILVEPMKILVDGFKPHKARETVREMLNRVGLPDSTLGKYPSELSGGQCQRIAIARALLLSPEVIICDECVSALDVSIQAQILNLLKDLQKEFSTAYLFISHDIGVIHYMSDFIVVINRGRIVESGRGEPVDPYAERRLYKTADCKLMFNGGGLCMRCTVIGCWGGCCRVNEACSAYLLSCQGEHLLLDCGSGARLCCRTHCLFRSYTMCCCPTIITTTAATRGH